MAGSTFGKKFKVMTWGESHGQALGVVIDGCPAGLMLNEDDIQKYLDLRKPGQNKYATQRNEDDKVEILSGIFQGKTTGTPISLIIYNKSQRSSDYSEIASYYRPGHADYTFDIKYGFRDYRGGGRSSGRETTARVAAGAIALKLLGLFGVEFTTYAKQIGPFEINMDNFDKSNISEDLLRMPDKETSLKAQEYLDKVRAEKDSVGDHKPYLIDPDALFGDREFDLAMTTVFGGFDNSFYQAYSSVFPFDDHLEERLSWYRFYYLCMHLILFGESYGGAVDQILSQY